MTLSDKQLKRFKETLLDMKARVEKSLLGATNEVKTPDDSSGYSQHQADEGTDDFGKTISIGVTVQEFSLLHHINRALEKLENESYGVCDISGEEIPIGRLEAVPYAVTTVAAQEKFEKGLN